jgi:hypothetical protein
MLVFCGMADCCALYCADVMTPLMVDVSIAMEDS